MRKNKVTVIPGFARLTGPAQGGVHTVDVDAKGANEPGEGEERDRWRRAPRRRLLPGLKADDRILTNIEILDLTAPPKSLIVIGAGAVGVEFASIFRSFGTEVTILEFLPRMVPVEDEEISKELARVFKKRGIETNTGAKVEKVEKTDDRREGELHRRERQGAGEGSREGAGGRGPRAAHERTSAWRRRRSSSTAGS